jgi:endonuclease/exonuclease/phosphatase family metal-dependent hydrolase
MKCLTQIFRKKAQLLWRGLGGGVLLLLLLGLFACGSDDKEPEGQVEDAPYLTVANSQKAVSLRGIDQSKRITVNTNRTFTATSNQSWCTAKVLMTGVDNLKISVIPNESATERTAQVVVSAPECADVAIEVVQYGGEISFNVMSFNIRYDEPADGQNNWQYRKDVVTEVVSVYDVDLLGVQEAMTHQCNEMKERLTQYTVAEARVDNASFYKTNKFEVERSGCFWLSETPDIADSKSWDTVGNRCTLWTVLKEKSSNKRLLFMNTHFDHVGTIARLESAKLVLERAKTLGEGLPIIIAGDFNAGPESAPMKTILHDGKFFDVRQLAPIYVDSGTFHGFGYIAMSNRGIIDYIFVTDDFTVDDFQVVPDMLNNIYLSDHAPLVAKISIKL